MKFSSKTTSFAFVGVSETSQQPLQTDSDTHFSSALNETCNKNTKNSIQCQLANIKKIT